MKITRRTLAEKPVTQGELRNLPIRSEKVQQIMRRVRARV